MKLNCNEIAALQLLLEFISLKDLVSAAMNGFSEKDEIKSQENSDLCFKALKSFLN